MNIRQLITFLKPITNRNHQFEIQLVEMNKQKGSSYYREVINLNVDSKYGVYVIYNPLNNKIVYIGKSGTIKNDGTFEDQNLNGRLLASRGNTTSHKYFTSKMNQYNFKALNFYVFYTKKANPPAYIEALSLHQYFKRNSYKSLPMFNQEFGFEGYWWCTFEEDSMPTEDFTFLHGYNLSATSDLCSRVKSFSGNEGLSVRCLKD
jgi:hypothetical protein